MLPYLITGCGADRLRCAKIMAIVRTKATSIMAVAIAAAIQGLVRAETYCVRSRDGLTDIWCPVSSASSRDTPSSWESIITILGEYQT